MQTNATLVNQAQMSGESESTINRGCWYKCDITNKNIFQHKRVQVFIFYFLCKSGR